MRLELNIDGWMFTAEGLTSQQASDIVANLPKSWNSKQNQIRIVLEEGDRDGSVNTSV